MVAALILSYILLVNHNYLGKLILKMYKPRLLAVDFAMSKSLKTLRVSLNDEWLEGKGVIVQAHRYCQRYSI